MKSVFYCFNILDFLKPFMQILPLESVCSAMFSLFLTWALEVVFARIYTSPIMLTEFALQYLHLEQRSGSKTAQVCYFG